MYLMYVDESGDVGMINSPTRYFVLTGLVLHELSWQSCYDQLVGFRKTMKQHFNLLLREEIHSGAFINNPGALVRIKRNDRLTILRLFADELASMSDIQVINIVVDKQKSGRTTDYDVFGMAWGALIQRFDNTLTHRNFKGPQNPDERGLLFPDHTDDKKLTQLLRQMRHYNPIPNQITYGPGYRNLRISKLLEDPSFRDSAHSLFIQATDLIAFMLYQSLAPSGYMRKKSGQNYFPKLNNILFKAASSTDPQGIVRI